MAAITVAMRTEISQLYVSLFGRAPDSEGLGFWVSSYAGGNTLAKIAQSMYETSPARAYYPLFATPSEIVTTFYANVLGRAPDAEGLAFWVNEFNSAATPGTFFAKLVSNVVNYNGTDEAGLTSQSLFNNKVAVAQFYGENGGTVAGATAALTGVTSDASTVDTAKSAILNPAPVVVAGQTIQLGSTVQTSDGGAGDDTFVASTVPGSITLNAGDILNGGSGTDTLSLTAGGTSDGVVFLNSIENVDVRLISSQSLDALGWVGVGKVEIADTSITDKTLTVSNASQATTFKISDDANLTVTYLDGTGSGDVALLATNGAGVSGSAATFTITDTETVSLTSSGVSYVAVVDTASTVKNINVAGQGTLTFNTDEAVTGVSFVNFSGTTDVTFSSAASDVTFTGGAGNDTINMRSTFNGQDSVNGGEGNDTLTASVAGVLSMNNVDNVETGTFKASGNAFIANMSGASFTTINLNEQSSTTDITINNIENGVTINLGDSGNARALTLDYVSGAAAVINLKSNGAESYSSMAVTDATSVTINQGAFSGTQTINSGSFDTDVQSITISVSSGDVVFDALIASGVTNLTLTSDASGSVTLTDVSAGTVAAVSMNAMGSGAAISSDGVVLASGAQTINITTSGNASVNLNAATVSQSSGAMAVTISVGDSGDVGNTDDLDLTMSAGTASTITVDATVGSSGTLALGDLGVQNLTGSTVTLSRLTVGSSGLATVAGMSADTIGAFSISVGQSGSAVISAVTGDNVGAISITGSGRASIDIHATSGVGSITIGDGSNGGLATVQAKSIGAVALAGNSGTLTASASGSIGNIVITGSGATVSNSLSASFGNITVAGNGTVSVNLGNATGVGTFTSVGHSGTVTLNASGATDSVTAELGNSTNEIYVSKAGSTAAGAADGDIYTLITGTGTSNFHLASTANQDVSIYNFDLTTSTDKIYLSTAAFDLGLNTAATAADIAAGALTVMATAGAFTMTSATQVVVLRSGTFGSVLDMLSGIASAGTYAITVSGEGVTAGQDIIVAWADTNGDTHITLVNSVVAASATALFSTVAAAQAVDTDDLAVLYGVNIATFSGSSFTNLFLAE
jgi:hypothetical protein